MTSKEATHLYRLQQWGEAVKDCKSSGKTVAAWCSEQGISKKTYYNWQKQVRDAACEELTVRQQQSLTASTFAECEIPAEHNHTAVVLHLNCGTVEIRNGADESVITGTLRALKSLC